jgi:hypothetical protein
MEEFVNKIKECWKSNDEASRESALVQFQKKYERGKEDISPMG